MKGKENKTKVLFLDIDGVLNSGSYFESDYYKFRKLKYGKSQAQIDDRTIPLLKKIHDETKCKIVMSSSWRCFYFDKKPELYRMLKKAGIRITDKIGNEYNNELSNKYHKHNFIQNEKGLYDVIWNKNPNPEPVKEFFGRGLQIQCWLKRHPEVKNFAILDDDAEDLILFGKHFVQTSWYDPEKPGLQSDHVEKCIELLGRRKNRMKKKIPESLNSELEKITTKDFFCFVTPKTNKKLKKWLKDKYEDYDFRELDFIEENTIYTASKQPSSEITFGSLIPSPPPLYEGIIENGELRIRQSGGLAFHSSFATLFAIPKEKVPEDIWKEMSENEYRGLRDVAFMHKFVNEKQ